MSRGATSVFGSSARYGGPRGFRNFGSPNRENMKRAKFSALGYKPLVFPEPLTPPERCLTPLQRRFDTTPTVFDTTPAVFDTAPSCLGTTPAVFDTAPTSGQAYTNGAKHRCRGGQHRCLTPVRAAAPLQGSPAPAPSPKSRAP